MNRNNTRRRFTLAWWWQLVLTLAPLFVVSNTFDSSNAVFPVLAMPFFVVGLISILALNLFDSGKQGLLFVMVIANALALAAAAVWLARRLWHVERVAEDADTRPERPPLERSLELARAEAAPVAAVRETSVVIATVGAALFLHERVGPARVAGAVLVAAGVALLGF